MIVSGSVPVERAGLRRASCRREHELMNTLRSSMSLTPIEALPECEVNRASRMDPGNWANSRAVLGATMLPR
jgi:hypothetical protein